MLLFLLSQDVNRGYDTYSAVVVAACDADDAVQIRPDMFEWDDDASLLREWVSCVEDVKVVCIGKASKGMKRGVVLASFHAG